MVLTEKLSDKVEMKVMYSDIVTEVKMGESEIQKLFAGSTVFITGGTGFLGKLLIEKLLRSCPDIKMLYLLVRSKKDKDISKRIQEQLDNELYDKLRALMPNFTDKIATIEGDVGQLEMGISEDDRMKIIDEVQFIFHVAATVSFDQPLKTAVEINVRGSREMLELARACKNLRAHVHVSTAYSNAPLQEIDEVIYEASIAGDKLIDLVENIDLSTLEKITPGLIGEFPNTYTYTKLAAEDIINKHSKGLPVAIFRPSIVMGTAIEPIEGWIDNMNGPTGATVAAMLGLAHVMICEPSAITDLVPGDMVVNALIGVAWKTAKTSRNNDEEPLNLQPTVYNYVSSEQAPISWGKFLKYNENYGLQTPTLRIFWVYFLFLFPSKYAVKFCAFFLHWIPAYIIDAVLILSRQKPMLRKIYKKIEKLDVVLSYFAKKQWKFYNKNITNLYNELGKADKQTFNFDMVSFNWDIYCESYIRGVRVFVLKDPLDTIPQAKIKLYNLKLLHYITIGLVCSVLLAPFIYITRLV